MALIDLVTENIVKVPLKSRNKPDVLRELVQILKDADQIEDFDAVLKTKSKISMPFSKRYRNGKTKAVRVLGKVLQFLIAKLLRFLLLNLLLASHRMV